MPPTRELHDDRLGKVLERLTNAGVTLNIVKCTFRVPKIKFLVMLLEKKKRFRAKTNWNEQRHRNVRQRGRASRTSPRGECERAVETTKSMLKREKDPTKGLLAYRSTPLACGYSPSELLIGRKLRNTIQPATLFLIWVGRIWKSYVKEKQKARKNKGWISIIDTILLPWKHSNLVFLCTLKIWQTLVQ